MIKTQWLITFVALVVGRAAIASSATACGHHDYPPWNWHKDGQIVGVCAEVTKKLFAMHGVEVDLAYIGPWKRCQKMIAGGSVNINICSFINDERKNHSVFINTPIGFNENAVFTKKGKTFQFKLWSDLSRKRAAIARGVSFGDQFDQFLNSHVSVTSVNNYEQAFRLLVHGRVDFVPLGRASGKTMLKMYAFDKEVIDLEEPILVGNLHLSMSKRSKHLSLLPKVESVMKEKSYQLWVQALLQKYTNAYADEYMKNSLEVREKESYH